MARIRHFNEEISGVLSTVMDQVLDYNFPDLEDVENLIVIDGASVYLGAQDLHGKLEGLYVQLLDDVVPDFGTAERSQQQESNLVLVDVEQGVIGEYLPFGQVL